MIKSYRNQFNSEFTQEKYEAFLENIHSDFNYKPPFKIAETPVFISKDLSSKLLEAGREIMNFIQLPNFKELTQGAFLSPEVIVPNEDERSKFIQMDFGICLDENGNPTPKLIEMQGFPSLFFYQEYIARMYRKHFRIPDGLIQNPHGLTAEAYIELLRQEIVGDTDPKQVVLLEIEPEKQGTAIDFFATKAALGIKILCITKVIKRGKELFYINKEGKEVRILKIYNRVIFDELYQRSDLKRDFSFTDELNVEWVGHPNWFFRISKYTMPLLKPGKYIPKAFHLDKLKSLPDDLENYVLKPLYSFAGAGVHIHVTPELIKNIQNKSNYLLQEKVAYAPLIETLDVPSKFEIRLMMVHDSKSNTTDIVSNLVRLSKGEMIGVKYNKDKTWVGGSLGFFEM